MQTSGVPFFITGGSGSGAGSLPVGGTAGQYLKKASGTNFDAIWASFALTNSDIDVAAAIAWSKLSKTGSSLADLATRSASDLSSGTLPDARFPATLPAVSGANLTALNASSITAGTVPLTSIAGITDTQIAAAAAIAWSKISKTGSSLADLTTRSASDLSSGTVPLARLSGITTNELSASAGIVDTQLATISTAGKVANSATTAASANTASAIVARDASGNFTAGTITATTFSGSGASLTSLPAANLTGTVPLTSISGLTNTQIASAAAIAYSKLALSSSIVDADVSASAAIGWSKVSKTGSSLADLATRTTANLTDFPSQTSNANKYLKTDGTNLSWSTVSGSAGTAFAMALLFGG